MNINTSPFSEDVLRAFNKVLADHENLSISINNFKELLMADETGATVEDFDPMAPDNKFSDGKFTEKGIEICYRLFDKGHNRNQVAALMDISFTAASHRYATWQALGGLRRTKQTQD